MTIAVTLKFDSRGITNLVTKLPVELPKEVANATFKYSLILAKALRREALIDPLRPITNERKMAAARITARRLSKFKSVVKMPQSLIFLDSMRPHYVSLKRGRAINRWARKNYGKAVVKGRSRVRRGPRGGITGGFLYVFPHRFVQRTLSKERNKLPNELRKGINKAFKASAI